MLTGKHNDGLAHRDAPLPTIQLEGYNPEEI